MIMEAIECQKPWLYSGIMSFGGGEDMGKMLDQLQVQQHQNSELDCNVTRDSGGGLDCQAVEWVAYVFFSWMIFSCNVYMYEVAFLRWLWIVICEYRFFFVFYSSLPTCLISLRLCGGLEPWTERFIGSSGPPRKLNGYKPCVTRMLVWENKETNRGNKVPTPSVLYHQSLGSTLFLSKSQPSIGSQRPLNFGWLPSANLLSKAPQRSWRFCQISAYHAHYPLHSSTYCVCHRPPAGDPMNHHHLYWLALGSSRLVIFQGGLEVLPYILGLELFLGRRKLELGRLVPRRITNGPLSSGNVLRGGVMAGRDRFPAGLAAEHGAGCYFVAGGAPTRASSSSSYPDSSSFACR